MGSYNHSPSSDHDQLLNPTSTKSSQPATSNLPLRKIPGGYGLPFFGPMKDRWDYFYNQGRDEFFKSRMHKYNSTIFRTNMPPGPFMNFKPQVVVLVDAVSFPTVFDSSKVDKTNALGGTYLPPAKFTGGYRTCAYLDPSDPKHTKLKSLVFSLIGSRHQNFIPETEKYCVAELFETIESQVFSSKGEANFNDLSGEMLFNLLFRLFFNVNPSETIMGPEGSKLVTRWQLFMLHPTITFGLPKFLNVIEDLLLHTYYLPLFPVKSGYDKFYSVIRDASTSILNQAEEIGIGRDEASHNLVFAFFLNGYGGLKTFFPTLMKYVALGGEKLHQQLRNEIRTVVNTSEEGLTFAALENMPLTKSVVYEAFRMEPPVPRQYGRAKKDFVVESHDASFEVKKGELILGFQPLAMRDGKVFVNPDEYVANRFAGEEGEKMLKYLYWSNNPETESPTEVNKQCPGRDLTLLITRLFVAELFLRYDTVSCDVVDLPTGASVKFKSFTKSTNKASNLIN